MRVEKLVVGLGNPGPDYTRTRHNVGFAVLDRVARAEKALFQVASRLDGYMGPTDFSYAELRDRGAWLLKPESYMNRSGAIVAPVSRWHGVEPEAVLVVYDDLDLPLGKLRIRPHGGPGTHNGMRSIVDELATERFPRLRVGIGAAPTDAARHVLERFTPAEQEVIDVALDQAADAIADWLRHGDIERCMTRFHSRWNQGA